MAPRRGTPHLLAVARGDEPADLLLADGSIFVPGTKEWLREDLAIADGMIAGWGPREAREVVDVSGAALTAGFIDAHMHLESTSLWVDEFVRAVLPAGTTAVAADPHELANVFGVRGVAALADAAAVLPASMRRTIRQLRQPTATATMPAAPASMRRTTRQLRQPTATATMPAAPASMRRTTRRLP
jgi:adenine deaminase